MAQLTKEQRIVLQDYARGATVTAIANTIGKPLATVTAIIAEVGNATAAAPGSAWPVTTRHLALPHRRSSPHRTTTAPEVTGAVVVRPAAEHVPRSSLEGILAAGDAHDQTRVRDIARRARALLDTLREVLEEEDKTAKARARVAELEAELAEARAALPGKKSGGQRNGEAAEIRRWAAANNVDCPRAGVIPNRVRTAYQARGGAKAGSR